MRYDEDGTPNDYGSFHSEIDAENSRLGRYRVYDEPKSERSTSYSRDDGNYRPVSWPAPDNSIGARAARFFFFGGVALYAVGYFGSNPGLYTFAGLALCAGLFFALATVLFRLRYVLLFGAAIYGAWHLWGG